MEKDKLSVLKKVLSEKKELDYWQIIKKTDSKYNLYITKNLQRESYLSGTREDFVVTVYRKIGREIGEATVTIVDFDEKSIGQKISEAALAAGLSKNPFYEPFADKQDVPKVKMHDSVFDKGPKEIWKSINILAEKMQAEVEKNRHVNFTCAEIITSDSTSVLLTSKGHNLKQRRSSVYTELVLTAKGKRGEVEFLSDKTETTFEKFNVADFVSGAVKTVVDISNAGAPEAFEGPVILTGPAIQEFFMLSLNPNPIVINASARAKYMHVSKFAVGKPIAKFKGEKITLGSNALIPQGLFSSSFDANCVPSRNLKIVESGILKNLVGMKQFADYLKIKPTGALGNIQVMPGRLPANDLYGKSPVVEIRSFSWFDPSPYAGDFASEIRLGYMVKNGKRTPFKGGMLVGSVFDAIADANYSKETVEESGYYGPKSVRFNKLQVSGL